MATENNERSNTMNANGHKDPAADGARGARLDNAIALLRSLPTSDLTAHELALLARAPRRS